MVVHEEENNDQLLTDEQHALLDALFEMPLETDEDLESLGLIFSEDE